jgi:hypothetical protein
MTEPETRERRKADHSCTMAFIVAVITRIMIRTEQGDF